MKYAEIDINSVFEQFCKWRATRRLKDHRLKKDSKKIINELNLDKEQAYLVGCIDGLLYDMALHGFTQEGKGKKNFLDVKVRHQLIKEIWRECAD